MSTDDSTLPPQRLPYLIQYGTSVGLDSDGGGYTCNVAAIGIINQWYERPVSGCHRMKEMLCCTMNNTYHRCRLLAMVYPNNSKENLPLALKDRSSRRGNPRCREKLLAQPPDGATGRCGGAHLCARTREGCYRYHIQTHPTSNASFQRIKNQVRSVCCRTSRRLAQGATTKKKRTD